MIQIDRMYYFTINELWGPVSCEHPRCDNSQVFTIRLNQREFESLPEKSGPEAVKYIFENRIGVAVCDKHH